MNIEDKVPPWPANVTVPTHVPYDATMYVHKLAPGPNGVTWKMLPATVGDLIAACRKLGLSVSETKAAEAELREVGHGDRRGPSLDDIAKAEEYRSSSGEGRDPSKAGPVLYVSHAETYYMDKASEFAARIRELEAEAERPKGVNSGLREIAALEQSFAKRTSTAGSLLAYALAKELSVHLTPAGGGRWQVAAGVECVEALSAADFTTYSAADVPLVLARKLGVSE